VYFILRSRTPSKEEFNIFSFFLKKKRWKKRKKYKFFFCVKVKFLFIHNTKEEEEGYTTFFLFLSWSLLLVVVFRFSLHVVDKNGLQRSEPVNWATKAAQGLSLYFLSRWCHAQTHKKKATRKRTENKR
jgi:hypothetical protein